MMRRPSLIRLSLLKNHPLIFETIRHRSHTEWTLSIFINTVAWVTYLYLWKVLITGAAWYIGARLTYHEMIEQSGWKGFTSFFKETAPFGFLMCLLLWAWALINIWRFHEKVRRTNNTLPALQQDFQWTDIGQNELKQARSERILICSHNAKGELIGVIVSRVTL